MINTSLSQLVEPERLRLAWDHVNASDLADGVQAPSMARFGDRLDASLAELREQVLARSYHPSPLTPVQIAKRDGGRRELQIPSARDRVLERAILDGVRLDIDRALSPSSFGYRPGLSVLDAVRRVVELREDGWCWVVRTDVDDCFPTVDRNRLMLRLEQLLADIALLDLIGQLVRRPVGHGRLQRTGDRGIPQGGSLSPLLANLLLDSVDRLLMRNGHQVVRYADDLVVLARSQAQATDAIEDARRAAERNGFELSEDKTMVTSFEEGFYFLGEEFNQKYQPYQPTATRSEPTQRTLYVGVQGAGVRISRGRLIVDKQDHELLSVPTGHVERLVLSGAVGLSAGARSWALANDVDVVLMSRRGSFLGTVSGGHSDADLLRSQLRIVDSPDARIGAAKAMVLGKLRNQRVLLIRFTDAAAADVVNKSIDGIESCEAQIPDVSNLDVLRGVEGMAAKFYWSGFAGVLPEVDFEGRERRPPPDLVNAALGYGYAILLGECVAACQATGLHPSFGLLHSEEGRRPSLALDLMEEFRPLVIDQVVAELVRRQSLTTDHTRLDSRRGGVLLTEKGRQRLTAGIEDRLLTMAYHVGSGHRTSYRRSIQLQAAALARLFRHGEPYEAVRWR